MMAESQDEPESEADLLITCAGCPSDSFDTFEKFVKALGTLAFDRLRFERCNKFLKLKESEYCLSSEVLEYYRLVFSRKTITAVRRKWHIKDKLVLIWTVYKLCEMRDLPDLRMKYAEWATVARILGLPQQFLMRKWICLIRHTTFHFHWTPREEETLRYAMQFNNMDSKWSDLAIGIYKDSGAEVLRTCKDVREHWKNYLDPRINKANWTSREDEHMIQLINTYGKKWSLIARTIQGRTENQVKNRYLAMLKKEAKENPKDDHFQIEEENRGRGKEQLNRMQEQTTQRPPQPLQSGWRQLKPLLQVVGSCHTHHDSLIQSDDLEDYIHLPVDYASSCHGFFDDI